MKQSLVIGGGPAGLMAAEALADAGHAVTLADAMPTVGRKFLMAGKSGLNLTKDEPFEEFAVQYFEAIPHLRPILNAFGNNHVIEWAKDLEQDVFTGSTGRVFPKVMKASPLLRAWLARLANKGVSLNTRMRWVGYDDGAFTFETKNGEQVIKPDVAVLALGGASWARLGSDGQWVDLLKQMGADIAPFQAANVAVNVDWSSYMEPHFGAPIKSTLFKTRHGSLHGECVLSKTGLEGSAIYSLSRQLRKGSPLLLDLIPDLTVEQITERLARQPKKASMTTALRKALHLPPVKIALLQEAKRPLPRGADLAEYIKSVPVHYSNLADMDGAISTAGGVEWDSLLPDLSLAQTPNVFCAGEMLDWEAPTGGYLINGCLATGLWAGKAAAQYLD